MNIYYDPEKFGMEIVGEIEWSSGRYEFDLTVVWKDKRTGKLYYAEDSGCSCPSPFESQGVMDLIEVSFFSLAEHLMKRETSRDDSWEPSRAAEVTDLLGRLR